jgi:ribosomal protein L14
MTCLDTYFHVGDNSGVKVVKLIKIPGSRRYRARLGTIMRVSVISADPKSSIKKGSKHLALVCGLKAVNTRTNGATVRSRRNTAVLISQDMKVVGTRVLVPVPNEVRVRFPDIASKAKELY